MRPLVSVTPLFPFPFLSLGLLPLSLHQFPMAAAADVDKPGAGRLEQEKFILSQF